ncbi:MAG TPA: FtsX-like permease family protein [Polyangiaceae bacterium]|nr:FtsX-like permease family protein [Polyangiaceae bacterium]
MMTLKIAVRSFLRHRRRSVLTASAVALGLAMLLVFVGIADDTHARMAELGIRMGEGHVLVEAKNYLERRTLDDVVHGADELARRLAKLPNVRTVAVRLRTSGLIAAGEHSAPLVVAGVVPARELEASDISGERLRVLGTYLRPRAARSFERAPADVYLGKSLAEKLAVALGDRVVITVSPPGDAGPAAAAFIVRGIFRTGVEDLDGAYAEIPIDDARALLNLPDAATEIALLSELVHTRELTAAVRASLGGRPELVVLPWQEALRELFEALELDNAGLYLMMAIVFLVVAVGIFNTVLMNVSERTREFGVMLALGTAESRLFGQIMAEACVLAAVSIAFGLGIGLGLHALVAAHGIDLTRFTGEIQIAGVAWSGRVYSKLALGEVAAWSAGVALVVLASSLYPAWRVTRLEPVEAMHHV